MNIQNNGFRAYQDPTAEQTAVDDIYCKIIGQVLNSVGKNRRARIIERLNTEYSACPDSSFSDSIDCSLKQMKKRDEKYERKTEHIYSRRMRKLDTSSFQLLKTLE